MTLPVKVSDRALEEIIETQRYLERVRRGQAFNSGSTWSIPSGSFSNILTGAGPLSELSIDPDRDIQLSLDLLRSHKLNCGPSYPPHAPKAIEALPRTLKTLRPPEKIGMKNR